MKYLLDANTYIQANNTYYRMGVCPGYWDWLDQNFELGFVGSIVAVAAELKEGGDELTQWVKRRPEHFLQIDDEETQLRFAEIADFLVSRSGAAEDQVHDFLAGADPWLVAKAKALGATVVTHERLVGPDSKKVKIPNLCVEFRVPYMNTYDLLSLLEARLVLAS